MILRRFAGAIRRQDWFVALIELGILVLGIYIGLQVDDWNQLRQEKAASEEYLISLHADIVADIEMLESLRVRVYERREAADAVLDLLLNNGNFEDPGLFVRRLDKIGRIRFPTYETATYEDMVATGNLQVLDKEFREKISFYYRIRLQEDQTNDLQERRTWEVYLPMIVNVMPLSSQRWIYDTLEDTMVPMPYPDFVPGDAEITLKNLKQNPDLPGAIRAVIRGTWTQDIVVDRMLGRAKSLKAEIEAQTGIGEG